MILLMIALLIDLMMILMTALMILFYSLHIGQWSIGSFDEMEERNDEYDDGDDNDESGEENATVVLLQNFSSGSLHIWISSVNICTQGGEINTFSPKCFFLVLWVKSTITIASSFTSRPYNNPYIPQRASSTTDAITASSWS